MHWPVAFKSNKDIYNIFPTASKDAQWIEIDDEISIRDTWTGLFANMRFVLWFG